MVLQLPVLIPESVRSFVFPSQILIRGEYVVNRMRKCTQYKKSHKSIIYTVHEAYPRHAPASRLCVHPSSAASPPAALPQPACSHSQNVPSSTVQPTSRRAYVRPKRSQYSDSLPVQPWTRLNSNARVTLGGVELPFFLRTPV